MILLISSSVNNLRVALCPLKTFSAHVSLPPKSVVRYYFWNILKPSSFSDCSILLNIFLSSSLYWIGILSFEPSFSLKKGCINFFFKQPPQENACVVLLQLLFLLTYVWLNFCHSKFLMLQQGLIHLSGYQCFLQNFSCYKNHQEQEPYSSCMNIFWCGNELM